MEPSNTNQSTPSILEQISTRWALMSDPSRFILRYAPAIQRYLGALLRDPEAAAEVSQDLFVRLLQQRFMPEQIQRGRFRDYLKAVVRNSALTWLRREQSRGKGAELPAEIPGRENDAGTLADRQWREEWQRCLLDRVWDELDSHERHNPGSRCCSVLRLVAEFGEELDSTELADRLSAQVGETVRPDAFRKALSRARRLFANCLLREVARTLERPSVEAIEEELADLGLLARVLRLLPDDWRECQDWRE
jgi:RNA polymerase sigma-70 factor (ECF subfamily)